MAERDVERIGNVKLNCRFYQGTDQYAHPGKPAGVV